MFLTFIFHGSDSKVAPAVYYCGCLSLIHLDLVSLPVDFTKPCGLQQTLYTPTNSLGEKTVVALHELLKLSRAELLGYTNINTLKSYFKTFLLDLSI